MTNNVEMNPRVELSMRALRRAFVIVLVTAPVITFARNETLLNAAVITGSTRYSAADFTEVYAARIGQPTSRALLDAIVAEIEARYRRDGYVAPTIVAPDSEVNSTTPRIHVLEATIQEIALRGDAGPYADAIMDRASALRAGPIDRIATRRWLRELNTLPGLRVNAHFEPRSGANDLLLVLDTSYDAIDGALILNNRGSEDLGRILFSGRISANALLGWGESFSVYGVTTNEPDRYRFVGGSVERSSPRVNIRADVGTSRARLDDDREYE